VKLYAFLNAISQKAINLTDLINLQKDVVQCLVSFELVFPSFFFNIMTHLLVHLIKDISILGTVFLHNMFPFERFIGVLKKYVRNHAWLEGSIAQDYRTEEVIEFRVDFIPDLNPIGVPESRYEGRLSGKGTLGKKSHIGMEDDFFVKRATQFCKTLAWWNPISRYTRTLYDLNPQEGLKPRLRVSTWKLSAIGCENDVRVTRVLMSNCTCWLGNHLGMS
jgi:hypothetical protein